VKIFIFFNHLKQIYGVLLQDEGFTPMAIHICQARNVESGKHSMDGSCDCQDIDPVTQQKIRKLGLFEKKTDSSIQN